MSSDALKHKTFNVGAVYLMALVQEDGALLLQCFFNEHVYSRPQILAALDDAEAFLANLATHGPDAAP